MRIATNTFANNFLNQIGQLEQQQNTLQTQASSGQKITNPEDDPAGMAAVLNLQTSGSQEDQYQTNISNLQTAATTTYSAMDSLNTISSKVSEVALNASNSNTSSQQYAQYASQLNQYIQEALQAANTQDSDGNYIFGGTANGSPPFVATTDANGNITGVTYQGNTDVAESEVGPGMSVSVNVPGENTTGNGPAGLFADSRTGADFFAHLISLQKDLAAANTSAINANDVPQLKKDADNITTQISANGVTQGILTDANNVAAARSTNVTTQISSLTNADLAQTLTQLQQAQTAYQAALESGSKIFSVSLLNYLQ